MKSMFIPLRLATEARQLEFITELDESIDLVCYGSTCFQLLTDVVSINTIHNLQ